MAIATIAQLRVATTLCLAYLIVMLSAAFVGIQHFRKQRKLPTQEHQIGASSAPLFIGIWYGLAVIASIMGVGSLCMMWIAEKTSFTNSPYAAEFWACLFALIGVFFSVTIHVSIRNRAYLTDYIIAYHIS